MPDPSSDENSVGLLRRLAAVVYDALILFALIFIATFILMQILGGELDTMGRWILQICSLVIAYVYFGWFWTHGGQTVGMRAWRIRVVDERNRPIGWKNATQRFFAAMVSWVALGLGFLWSLWESKHRTWHDRLTRTRVVLLPKSRR